MTPLQKAHELINNMSVANIEDLGDLASAIASRDCAIIAVDEIIKSYSYIFDDFMTSSGKKEYGNNEFSGMSHFWKQVKKELEVL